MPRLDIRGTIIPNDYKWIYDLFEIESTCPADVQNVVSTAAGGQIDVYISSPGGEIASGSEIYTILSQYKNIRIHITGEAHSAASVIAMAGWSEMSPTALMMVHCVSTRVDGPANHAVFEHTAEVLRAADEAMGSAYERKSGMERSKVSEMMDHETWLTAERAVELGLVDQVMETAGAAPLEGTMAAGPGMPGREKMERIRDAILKGCFEGAGTPERMEDILPGGIAADEETETGDEALPFAEADDDEPQEQTEDSEVTYDEFLEQRKQLTEAAQAAIDGGAVEEADRAMEDIAALDNEFDALKEAQSKLDNAIALEPAAASSAAKMLMKAGEAAEMTGGDNMPIKLNSASEEYVIPWAKTMMKKTLTDDERNVFESVNREYGLRDDATTTSSAAAVVPDSVAKGIWSEVEDLYPYYADVAKTSVEGNYVLTQGTESSDASWYEEDAETADGTEKFANYILSGCELARNIRVSWKLKEMAVADFIPYIQRKIAEKMGVGCGYGVVSGAGKADSGAPEPLGVVTALNAQSGTPQVVTYSDGGMTYADFTKARGLVKSAYAAGLKVYANSATVWGTLANISDANGRPYFMADPMTGSMRFLGLEVAEDASFADGDVLISNASRGYQVNINKQISLLDQNDNVKRQTIYTGYAVLDGAPVSYYAHALLTAGGVATA